MKTGIFLLFLVSFLKLHAQDADTSIYASVDKEPVFRYKDGKTNQESINLFFQDSIIFPEVAADIDVTGRVIIECIVEKNGHLSNCKIKKGLESHFDAASIDLIRRMPSWVPAEKKGKKVRYKMNICVIWRF